MLYFFVFLFGLAIGSFLNVVICRLEKKKLILSDRSKCPKCKTVLKWHDLIPVLSFIFTWGRCRYCQKKISWQYPMVEIFTGIIFLLIFKQFSLPAGEAGILNFQTLELFYYFIIVSFLIIIFVYDLRHYLIPDKIVFPAIVIAVIFNLQFLISKQFSPPAGEAGIFKFSILGALGASLFFSALILLSKGRWMGWGDVKLTLLMGLFLGWPMILVAMFLSFFSGATVGIWLIVLGKKRMKSEIPFGPFLAGSTILVFVFSSFFESVFQNLIIF